MNDKILVPLMARVTALEFLVEFLMTNAAQPYGLPSVVMAEWAKEHSNKLSQLSDPKLDPIQSDVWVQEITDAFDRIMANAVRRSQLSEGLSKGQG
ncbi:MAG: hypothetical protein KG075_05520 [Alphaproteobacteria bacterium]|nr:hypothetical protein [Alphaproteobacteria bacterium]